MKKLALYLLTAPLLLFMMGCDITSVRDAVDDFDLIIQLEPIETYLIVEIVDAETGDLINGSVELSFDGPDAGSIIDFYSDPVRHLEIRGGMAMIGVQQGIVPQEGSPVLFRVTADGAGYDEGFANVRLDDRGEHKLSIPLASVNHPLQGSGRAAAETWLTAGRTAAFSLSTRANSDVAAADVFIPAGSSLKTADGKDLAGSLTVNLTHFDATHSSALTGFPGGFAATTVRNGSTSGPATIVAAGFTNFTARSSEGDVAAEFSHDVVRTVEIAPNALNPQTGTAYQPGDNVTILGYNRGTGEWEYETTATVEAGASKSGSVPEGASVPSVTYSSRRIGFLVIGGVVEACSSGITFHIDRNGHDGALRGMITGPDGSGYMRSIEVPAGSNQVTVRELPDNVRLELRIDLPGGQNLRHSFLSSCGGREQVSLPASSASAVDVHFSVDLSCTLRLQPPFNATLNYKLRGAPGGGVSAGVPDWTTDAHGRVTGGSLVVPGMYMDESYRFILVTPEETAWEDVTITEAEMHFDVDVPQDLCRR